MRKFLMKQSDSFNEWVKDLGEDDINSLIKVLINHKESLGS